MPTLDPWPLATITREALFIALLSLGAPRRRIRYLKPAKTPRKDWPDPDKARDLFLQAAAIPEQRDPMAEALGLTYAEITNWVIRADLMRVKGVDACAAQALALAGVAGARDLYAWISPDSPAKPETRRRFELLKRDFAERFETEEQLAAAPDEEELKAVINTLSLEKLEGSLKRLADDKKLYQGIVTDTSVILVVKGAGLQKADDTLDEFIRGFWPALKSVDPIATLGERHDIFPPDYRPSVYDRQPLNHVIEARSGERRIWIKEPYWEAGLNPANPLQTIEREWRMATYAFGSGIYELFTKLPFPSEEPKSEARLLYGSFAILYALVLWQPLLVLSGVVEWTRTVPFLAQIGLAAAGAVLLALVAGYPAALEAREWRKASQDKANPNRLQADTRLPGLGGWVLGLLILGLLLNPVRYTLVLGLVVLVELALLRARASAWKFRELANSDTDTWEYYSKPKGGIDRRERLSMKVTQLVYRGVVVFALPITFLGLVLARLLKWTRVLRGMGDAIDEVLSTVLSGVLGDVATYATDPAQAHRVRGAIAADLQFFHDHPHVSRLHMFAHSQGTPITFETLFHHLPGPYRRKIITYATIGSVLSYYHQINPILDPIYILRFPVRPYPSFCFGFKWMNFWNLIDPITEFYGLDEYNLATEAPKLTEILQKKSFPSPEDVRQKKLIQREPASPTNIKTPATAKHHGEYWTNQDQVQRPFARRVLGDLRPPEWAPDKVPADPPKGWGWLKKVARRLHKPFHSIYLYFQFVVWLLVLAAFVAVTWWGLTWVLSTLGLWVVATWDSLEPVLADRFPGVGETGSIASIVSAWENGVGFWNTPEVQHVRDEITIVALALTGLWALISLILQTAHSLHLKRNAENKNAADKARGGTP